MLSREQIIGRLEAIETDLANRQEPGAKAAEDYHREKRNFEEEWARTYVETPGQPTERKNATLLALATSKPYKDLIVAEAAYEGWRAAMRALEARSMIGMALLKSVTREPSAQPDGEMYGGVRAA